ncbi:glycosyltransferase [Candidatus Woesearchaeota archaeon]|nr:glycosyltransferase [Candidatus Woesearchaeota archaeon]
MGGEKAEKFMGGKNPRIVVTIPAFNEEKTIGNAIIGIREILPQAIILVADDGSKDNTRKIALGLGAKVVSHPTNKGLGETFRTEMKEALRLGAEIIVHIDADGQYLAKDIPSLLRPIIEKKADLVLGSRFTGHIESMPLVKRFGNKAFSMVVSGIAGKKITDSQTGFRAFTAEAARLPVYSLHTYTQEQIIRAVKQKLKIAEVPVHFARRKDKSRLISNPFSYAGRAGMNILRIYRDYEPLKFFGAVGMFFIGLGIVLGAWIVYSVLTAGNVGGIPRVILSALFIMTGIQITLFGFLADMLKR